MCCPKNHSIIIIRKCKHFTLSSLARNDRCEHFTLSDLWRCAHEKQKNTCRKTIPSHHGMPSKWIDRSSMVCGTRHQTGNFLQLGKQATAEHRKLQPHIKQCKSGKKAFFHFAKKYSDMHKKMKKQMNTLSLLFSSDSFEKIISIKMHQLQMAER